MDMNNIIAALSGLFTGGGEAWQQNRQRQRQQQQQDRLDRQEQDRIALAKQQADRQALNDEQSDVGKMLTDVGPNGALTPDQYGRVDRAKLGYRTQVAPDEDLSHSLFTGLTPFGGMNVPAPQFSVAPTAAERQAQTAKDAAAEETRQKKINLTEWMKTQRPEVQSAVQYGQLTGKEPTLQPDTLADPAVQAQRALDTKVNEQKTLGPLRTNEEVRAAGLKVPIALKQAAGEAAIKDKYKVPIPRAPTGSERQALGFYNRAQQAVDTIAGADKAGKSLEERVAESGLGTQVGLQYLPNMLQSTDQQKYRNAQRTFTEARLRKESGAAINASEYENDSRMYFAQPGDDAETISQKQALRQTVLNGMANTSGPAYAEYYGEPAPKPARTASPGATPPGAVAAPPGGTVKMRAPGGKAPVLVPAGQVEHYKALGATVEP